MQLHLTYKKLKKQTPGNTNVVSKPKHPSVTAAKQKGLFINCTMKTCFSDPCGTVFLTYLCLYDASYMCQPLINSQRSVYGLVTAKQSKKPPLHSNWSSSFTVATQLFHTERASSGPLRQRCSSNSLSYDDPCCCVAKAYLVNFKLLVTPHAFCSV